MRAAGCLQLDRNRALGRMQGLLESCDARLDRMLDAWSTIRSHDAVVQRDAGRSFVARANIAVYPNIQDLLRIVPSQLDPFDVTF